MKRKMLVKKIAVFSLVIILSFTFLISAQTKLVSDTLPKIIFPVISDIHIGGAESERKFQNALEDYKEIYPRYDAIVMVGDITNGGKESQYRTFMQILNSNKANKATEIILMGNHEYMAGDSSSKGYETRFVKETSMPYLYYDQRIKGYHFIALAPENMGGADLSVKQLSWLKTKLNENRDKRQPIFVFLHQPLPNTVYGSKTWGDVINYKKLNNILKKYPQVILFSGHSHYILDNDKTIIKKSFTMFNTGAVYYTMLEGDKYSDPSLSEGLLVEVYQNKVVIKCREFSKHKWLGETYIINT